MKRINEQDDILIDGTNYALQVSNAIKSFWRIRNKQLINSGDSTNRGSVVGGKQMDDFVALLRNVAENAGIPSGYIITNQNHLPGYFRSTKDWDLIIISPNKKLIAAVELKSQIGSYGNNFNNRTEEAIGSAVDLWTAFREGQFPNQNAPWVGWLMVIGKDVASQRIVRNYEPRFKVRAEFNGASYIDRYNILCRKLILERHYTSTALVWTSNENDYGDVSNDTSISSFMQSFYSYLKGLSGEFL